MDWDNARIFLAIYRNGTLRGAAALLQIDQATAGRRLAALTTPSWRFPTSIGQPMNHDPHFAN
eukprot:SAG22_NODE_362_length_11702_cov_5.323882_1_plen_62_part_10